MSPHPHLTQINILQKHQRLSVQLWINSKAKKQILHILYYSYAWCVWKSKFTSPCWIGQNKFAQQRTSLCKMNMYHRWYNFSFREVIPNIPGTRGRPRRCRNWAARSRRCHWRACSAAACPWRSPALRPSLITETEAILTNHFVQFAKIPRSKSTGEKRSSTSSLPERFAAYRSRPRRTAGATRTAETGKRWREGREERKGDGRGFKKVLEGAEWMSSSCCAMAEVLFPSLACCAGFWEGSRGTYERKGPLSEKGIVPTVWCRLRIFFCSMFIRVILKHPNTLKISWVY